VATGITVLIAVHVHVIAIIHGLRLIRTMVVAVQYEKNDRKLLSELKGSSLLSAKFSTLAECQNTNRRKNG
jgi:hypothetical protein